jgi:hypothetical protein
MKKLIQKAYEMGKESFGKYKNSPHLNPEFMATVPNCPIGDDKGCRLRIKMYKEYTKGWTESHIASMEF